MSILIGAHAFLGEIGIACFLWVFIEMLNPTESSIKRAKIASLIGVILFFASWIVGGYYYATDYGASVKPVIKEGPQPWAHLILMEVKEHIFLFLPFISILAYSLISKFQLNQKDSKTKKSISLLSLLIIFMGALMALMGYLISSSYRLALEAAP